MAATYLQASADKPLMACRTASTYYHKYLHLPRVDLYSFHSVLSCFHSKTTLGRFANYYQFVSPFIAPYQHGETTWLCAAIRHWAEARPEEVGRML